MSVAGILASSLFSHIGSSSAQKTAGGASGSSQPSGSASGAQSIFSAVQQQLSAQGTSAGSLPAQMTQLGQDLKAGNLSGAQSDFNNVQAALSQISALKAHHTQPQSGTPTTGLSNILGTSGTGASDSLTAALQAYSSLQQNPLNSALSSSLLPNTSAFSVNA